MTTRTKGRGCDGKLRNATREDALGQIARMAGLGANPGRFEAYHCQHCGAWHIGHRPKPRRTR